MKQLEIFMLQCLNLGFGVLEVHYSRKRVKCYCAAVLLWSKCSDNSEGELCVRTGPVFQCVPVLQCSWVLVQCCCVSCSEGG